MSWEALLPYASWLGSTSFALWLGASTWRIAWLLAIHLFGLTLLLGSVIVTSLNLLGLFQPGKSPDRLRRQVPWGADDRRGASTDHVRVGVFDGDVRLVDIGYGLDTDGKDMGAPSTVVRVTAPYAAITA